MVTYPRRSHVDAIVVACGGGGITQGGGLAPSRKSLLKDASGANDVVAPGLPVVGIVLKLDCEGFRAPGAVTAPWFRRLWEDE